MLKRLLIADTKLYMNHRLTSNRYVYSHHHTESLLIPQNNPGCVSRDPVDGDSRTMSAYAVPRLYQRNLACINEIKTVAKPNLSDAIRPV